MARGFDDAHAARAVRLPFSQKLGYSAGQIVDGVVTQSVNLFVLFYATAVCGLSGALAGIALAAGLVVDAVVDPLIGSVSDGWRSRFGRRLPFMLVGLPAIVISFVLIFSLPRGIGQVALFLILMALSIALRVSMSLFMLPYQAVGAEVSDDYAERSSIMAWRWGVGMLGTLATILLGFGVFFSGAQGLGRRDAYTPFALALSGLVIAAGLISARATRATQARQHPPLVSTDAFRTRILGELGEVFRNRSFVILFIAALLYFTALATHTALALHAYTYFWKLQPDQTRNITLAVFSGLLLGAPLAGPLLQRVEKKTVLVVGLIGYISGLSIPALLRMAGLLMQTGGTLTLILACVQFAGGILLAVASIAFASMMADAADEHEHLFGARREGLYFAGWSFASKAASGAGALIAGLVLQLIAFPSGVAEHAQAVADLPQRSITLLGICYGPGAGLLGLAAVATCLLYRLDAKAHATIMGDLQKRRGMTMAIADSLLP